MSMLKMVLTVVLDRRQVQLVVSQLAIINHS